MALTAPLVVSIPSITLAADAGLPVGQRAARHYRAVEECDGDAARLVVQTAILVRRSMEPTGRGVGSNIGRPIPTRGVQATTTLSTETSAVESARFEDAGARQPKDLEFHWRMSTLLPSTKTSILVRKKQSSASAGLHTTGSFSLKDVLRTIGTSVSTRNASISA